MRGIYIWNGRFYILMNYIERGVKCVGEMELALKPSEEFGVDSMTLPSFKDKFPEVEQVPLTLDNGGIFDNSHFKFSTFFLRL